MIRLIRHELRKMWSRREFLFFAALILLVNLILLFVAGNGRDGRLASRLPAAAPGAGRHDHGGKGRPGWRRSMRGRTAFTP